jgi:cytoskeletal protein RodZ
VREELQAAGARLREARLERGLSLVEVARRTNVRVEHLRRLESGALDDLPDDVYARAFARTYAAELGVREVTESLSAPGQNVAAGNGSTPVADPTLPAPRAPGSSALWALPLTLLGVGAIVAAVLLWGSDEASSPGGAAEQRPERASSNDRRKSENGDGRRPAALPTPAQEFPPAAEQSREPESAPAGTGLEVSSKPGVAVCILSGEKATAVNGQLERGESKTLAGSEFTLVFPEGFDPSDIEAAYDGKRVDLIDTQGPSAVRISGPGPAEVVELPPAPCG